MNRDLIADLKRDEGFRKSAYQDSEGYWTIGYGTLIDARLNAGITRDEAEILMTNRLSQFTDELLRSKPYVLSLPEPVQRGVLNMLYNLGAARLLGFKKMWAAIEARDWAIAADEALDSKWARQVGERSQRIAKLIVKAAP